MPDIKHLLTIERPSKVVYDAVTLRDGLAGWWTTEVSAKPETGSIASFRFGDTFYIEMKVTNLEPHRKVEWECVVGADEWIGTKLTFELAEDSGKTILKFSHSHWREVTDFFASCNYNWGWYLTSLKNYCETGEGQPFGKNKR